MCKFYNIQHLTGSWNKQSGLVGGYIVSSPNGLSTWTRCNVYRIDCTDCKSREEPELQEVEPCVDSLKVRPHYATWQNATHCSFAAWQKLLGICRQCDRVHMKKKFFADLQIIKTVERDQRTWSNFFLKLADTTHHMPHSFFWWTDNLPIEFLGRAASNGMPQPSRHNVHIYLWHGITFATRPCHTLPLCAAWHSVDIP